MCALLTFLSLLLNPFDVLSGARNNLDSLHVWCDVLVNDVRVVVLDVLHQFLDSLVGSEHSNFGHVAILFQGIEVHVHSGRVGVHQSGISDQLLLEQALDQGGS